MIALGPTRRTLSIKANLADGKNTIPDGFVSFGIGLFALLNGLINGSATSLISLIRMISSNKGWLQINGSESDALVTPVLTTQNVNDLYAFMTALGPNYKCFYQLGFTATDPTPSVTNATALNAVFGNKMFYQIGSEAYERGFNNATYAARWNSYYSALNTALPGLQYLGPDDGRSDIVQGAVAGITPGKAGLSGITTHRYPMAAVSNPTAEQLIGSTRFAALNQFGSYFTVGLFNNIEWAGALPLFNTQHNSCSGGGLAGVSDRLCSATWYLNEAMLYARYGFSGICTWNNLWWNGSAGWTTGAVVGIAPPNVYGSLLLQSDLVSYAPGVIFYGQYLFSRIQGQQIISALMDSNANQTSLCTIGAGGNANILVVNNDTVNPLIVTPDQTSAWSTANVLMLSGTGPYDAAPTLGGAAIGVSGAWSGAPASIANGASVTLPPCCAALISIQS